MRSTILLLTTLALVACDDDSTPPCGPGSGRDAPCCEPPLVEEVVCPTGQQPLKEGDRRAVCLDFDESVGFTRPVGPHVTYASDGTVIYGDRADGGERFSCDDRQVVARERAVYVPCDSEGFCACVLDCWDSEGMSTPCRMVNPPELMCDQLR
ncbi:MAG: hypothetical protein ACE366_12425 [Bradymonadia bacterium]